MCAYALFSHAWSQIILKLHAHHVIMGYLFVQPVTCMLTQLNMLATHLSPFKHMLR